jgi:predicted phosphodiesterase
LRYLICSDVHSNLEALLAVLREAEKEKPDRFFMLGDIVGYGPDPQECLRQTRKTADVVLAGNHDYGVISLTDTSYFNSFAQAALLWTRDQISDREAEYLAQLPLLHATDGFFLFTPPLKTPKCGNTYSL